MGLLYQLSTQHTIQLFMRVIPSAVIVAYDTVYLSVYNTSVPLIRI
jgi:hypothetical protein